MAGMRFNINPGDFKKINKILDNLKDKKPMNNLINKETEQTYINVMVKTPVKTGRYQRSLKTKFSTVGGYRKGVITPTTNHGRGLWGINQYGTGGRWSTSKNGRPHYHGIARPNHYKSPIVDKTRKRFTRNAIQTLERQIRQGGI